MIKKRKKKKKKKKKRKKNEKKKLYLSKTLNHNINPTLLTTKRKQITFFPDNSRELSISNHSTEHYTIIIKKNESVSLSFKQI